MQYYENFEIACISSSEHFKHVNGCVQFHRKFQRNPGIIQLNSTKLKKLSQTQKIQQAQLSENNCTSANIFFVKTLYLSMKDSSDNELEQA